jgi:hypothetical protein
MMPPFEWESPLLEGKALSLPGLAGEPRFGGGG